MSAKWFQDSRQWVPRKFQEGVSQVQVSSKYSGSHQQASLTTPTQACAQVHWTRPAFSTVSSLSQISWTNRFNRFNQANRSSFGTSLQIGRGIGALHSSTLTKSCNLSIHGPQLLSSATQSSKLVITNQRVVSRWLCWMETPQACKSQRRCSLTLMAFTRSFVTGICKTAAMGSCMVFSYSIRRKLVCWK